MSRIDRGEFASSMTTFDKREEAYENRFAHDEELLFKARARCASKMARWAAGLLGKTGADLDAYAQAQVDLQVSAGNDALLNRLRTDLAQAGHAVSDRQLSRRMDDAMIEAEREVRDA